MDLGLKEVPAAVAGASKGLGYAVALELATEGARVAICSRDSERIKTAASSIEKQTGAQVHPIVADVSKPDGAESFVNEAATALGGLQVLVANAGGPNPAAASTATDQEWLEALDLNFLSAVRMVRSCLPYLKAAPFGRVVCITSISVKQPMSNLVFSNAVRSATTSFAKTLSMEVGADNITVNCVLPGQIATDRLRYLSGAPADAGPDHPAFQAMASQIPMGRIGTPEEFAAVVTFLCSARASFLSGVALQVDGGYFKGLL
ncbi:MAG: SDR family oxidoreductase [Acidimicrobiia bacterium]